MTFKNNIVLVTGLSLVLVLLGGCPQQEAGQGQPATATASGGASATSGTAEHTAAANLPAAEPLPAGQWWGDGCDPHHQGNTAATGPTVGKELLTVKAGRLNGHLGVLPGGLVVAGMADGVKAIDLAGNVAWDVNVRGEYDAEITSGPPGGETGVPGFREGDMPMGGGPGGPAPSGEIHPAAGGEGGPPPGDGNGGHQPDGPSSEGAIDFVVSAVPAPRIILRCNYTVDVDVKLFGMVPGTYGKRACSLRAYDATGAELWRLGVTGSIKGQPCLTDDGALLGLQLVSDPVFHASGYMEQYQEKAELLRVSADGNLEWHKILPRLDVTDNPPEETTLVMLRDGNIGFVWVDRFFHVFNADSFQQWVLELKSNPDGPPAVSPEGMILLQGSDRPQLNEKQLELMKWDTMNLYGLVHSIKPTGVHHWDLQAGSDIQTPVAVGADGRIYFATEIFTDDRAGRRSNGKVYCLNAKGQLQYGTVIPNPPADFPEAPAPLVDAAGTLYIADDAGKLYAISSAGDLLWQAEARGRFTTNPVVCGGMLFIGAGDTVYAYGTPR